MQIFPIISARCFISYVVDLGNGFFFSVLNAVWNFQRGACSHLLRPFPTQGEWHTITTHTLLDQLLPVWSKYVQATVTYMYFINQLQCMFKLCTFYMSMAAAIHCDVIKPHQIFVQKMACVCKALFNLEKLVSQVRTSNIEVNHIHWDLQWLGWLKHTRVVFCQMSIWIINTFSTPHVTVNKSWRLMTLYIYKIICVNLPPYHSQNLFTKEWHNQVWLQWKT